MDTSVDEQQAQELQKKATKQRIEDRKIITPYAFEVPESLYGTPLASPMRRGWAMLLDFMLVAILTGVSGHALTILIGILVMVAAYRMKKRGNNNKSVRWIFFGGAFLLFIALLDVGFNSPPSYYRSPNTYSDVNGAQTSTVNVQTDKSKTLATALYTGKYLFAIANLDNQLASGSCATKFDCWKTLSEQLVDDMLNLGVTDTQGRDILKEFVQVSADDLNKEQTDALNDFVMSQFQAGLNDPNQQTTQVDLEAEAEKLQQMLPVTEVKNEEADYSIIKWLKGIASDLGLGFGWAAFYFTAFTGLFNGQTPGKRVFGIKIIKLDGSKLNLWESFGRYGGYGAGFATGLLGFLQVFWDANRQAIQDKISETMVINIRKPKQQYKG